MFLGLQLPGLMDVNTAAADGERPRPAQQKGYSTGGISWLLFSPRWAALLWRASLHYRAESPREEITLSDAVKLCFYFSALEWRVGGETPYMLFAWVIVCSSVWLLENNRVELVSHTDFCVINSHKLTDEKNETVAAHGVEWEDFCLGTDGSIAWRSWHC